MKIPKTFKVGALTWRVEIVPGGEMSGDCGNTDRARKLIKINADMDEENRQQTFIHEVIHVLEIDLPHSYVETLAILLHQVFRQVEG